MQRRSASGPRSRSAFERRRRNTGLLAVLPLVVLVCVFFLIPLALTFWMSLTSWNLAGMQKFIGIDNYLAIPKDKTFIRATAFTIIYAAAVTVLTIGLGMLLALM